MNETHEQEETLVGLRIIAGCLVVIGLLMALYFLLFSWLICLIIIRHGQPPNSYAEAPTFGFIAIAAGIVTYVCFKASSALRNGRRWAAYVAFAWACLFLMVGALWIYGLYHPHREAADEYFGILFVPPIIVVGVWWCIYLNLPHVRAYLRRRNKDSSPDLALPPSRSPGKP